MSKSNINWAMLSSTEDYANITVGDFCIVNAGDDAKITVGNSSKAFAEMDSELAGGVNSFLCAGYNSTFRGGEGTVFCCEYYEDAIYNAKRRVKTVIVGQNGILPNVTYHFDETLEFVRVKRSAKKKG